MTDPCRMVLAMLGYQRWLPREMVRIAQLRNKPVSQAIQQNEQAVPAQRVRQSVPPQLEQKTAHSSEPNVAQSKVKPAWLMLAPGVILHHSGVLIYDEGAEFAWFLPHPYRHESGWSVWREARESTLLLRALAVCGWNVEAELLKRYFDVALTFSASPDEHTPLCDLPLPLSVKKIFTFSGLAWQNIVGEGKNEGSAILDWHGRQVQVRCLPHPYYCLIDPRSKEKLWRSLVRVHET